MRVMTDNITLQRIQQAHPALREELGKIYEDICKALTGRSICRFAYVVRTFAEQKALYDQGRTKPGKKVTNAGPGLSYHNYGLAVDIVLLKDKDGNGTFETASWETEIDFDGDGQADWQEIVTIFKQYGWTWGGNWKFTDKPHFEKTFGYPVRALLDKFNKSEFIPGTNYVRL